MRPFPLKSTVARIHKTYRGQMYSETIIIAVEPRSAWNFDDLVLVGLRGVSESMVRISVAGIETQPPGSVLGIEWEDLSFDVKISGGHIAGLREELNSAEVEITAKWKLLNTAVMFIRSALIDAVREYQIKTRGRK